MLALLYILLLWDLVIGCMTWNNGSDTCNNREEDVGFPFDDKCISYTSLWHPPHNDDSFVDKYAYDWMIQPYYVELPSLLPLRDIINSIDEKIEDIILSRIRESNVCKETKFGFKCNSK